MTEGSKGAPGAPPTSLQVPCEDAVLDPRPPPSGLTFSLTADLPLRECACHEGRGLLSVGFPAVSLGPQILPGTSEVLGKPLSDVPQTRSIVPVWPQPQERGVQHDPASHRQ